MTLADRARQVADAAPKHQSAEVLRECADEIDRLRKQRDREAWMHAACLTIAETGEKWGDGVTPSLAMREVWELRQCRDQLRDDRKDLCEERARLRADLAALRAAVRELPEVKHAGDCTTHVTSLRREYGCDCGAESANAALAAAKKMAGEP